MKQTLLKPLIALLSLPMVFALTGCKDDGACEPGAAEGTKEVSFSLNYTSLSPTRALTTTTEKTIAYLDVIAFVRDDENNETFAYKTYATSINDNMAKARVLIDESHQYCFALVANMKDEIAALTFSVEDTPAQVYEKIVFAAYASGDSDRTWDTTTPRYLPMWGVLSDWTTITENNSSLGTIYMLRAVATVDVLLDADMSQWNYDDPELIAPLSGYELKKVRVYNVPDRGRGVPSMDNINYIGAGTNASKPTMPTTFSRLESDYITYTPITHSKYIQKCIYIPEAFNNSYNANNVATMLPYNQRTCLVVQIENTATGVASWYRMDFVKKKTDSTEADAVWDILRNHRYRFYITAIKGDGYGSPEEAYESTAVNLESEVINWNDDGNNTVIVYGKNYLSYNGDGAMIVADQQSSTTRFYFKTDAITWNGGLPTNLTMKLDGDDGTTVTNVTTVSNRKFTVQLVRDDGAESYYFLVTANTAYSYPTDANAEALLTLTFGQITFSLDIAQVPNNWNQGEDFEKEL